MSALISQISTGGRMSRRRLLLTTASTAVVVLGGATACIGNSGPNRDNATTMTGVSDVAVRDDYFEPASIEVPAGTTVTWRWEGQHSHNVVSEDRGNFESPVQQEGEFTVTFDEPGNYPYECTLHHGMTGEVIVTPAG